MRAIARARHHPEHEGARQSRNARRADPNSDVHIQIVVDSGQPACYECTSSSWCDRLSGYRHSSCDPGSSASRQRLSGARHDTCVHVGEPISRREDARLLTGRRALCRTTSIWMACCTPRVFRSAWPHGRIRSIDVAAAAAMPGVIGVFHACELRSVAQADPLRALPRCPASRISFSCRSPPTRSAMSASPSPSWSRPAVRRGGCRFIDLGRDRGPAAVLNWERQQSLAS